MAERRLDIHNLAHQYERAQRHLQGLEISARNKALIFAFRDACLLRQVCGTSRLIHSFCYLGRSARILGKDFDTAERADIERIITTFMNEGLKPYTIVGAKSILKRFMTYVKNPEEFPNCPTPPCVAWMRTHVRKKDERRLQRTELLTPQDIERLLAICRNPRDKALIAVLWETGARISELGNLQLKHITKHPHGYTLDVDGKTGKRSPLIVSSAPYLSQWLANHPFRDQPDAPLWVHNQFDTAPQLLKYVSIRYLLQRYFARAGITKPFHPHVFRHSRATFLLSQGIMNESQAKSYFGWTSDSEMLATYSHLIDQDANNAILRENNLVPKREAHDALKPITCHVCNELNPPGTDYCTKCNAVLNLKRAYEHQQVHELHDDVTLELFRILVEKGLIDQAARAVHDAGLGTALRMLAAHQTNRPARTIPAIQLPAAQPLAPTPAADQKVPVQQPTQANAAPAGLLH